MFNYQHQYNENNYAVRADTNAMLKLKFQQLHSRIVDNIDAAEIIDFLFKQGVVRYQDVRALQRQSNPQQQCRDLLMLLHSSQHPQAFVQLYRAIRNEPHLQWLVECVDEFRDQSVIDALQERYLSEPTGKCETSN